MILLDTSVLVEIDRFVLPDEPLALSSISYGEMAMGVRIAADLQTRTRRQSTLALVDSLGLTWLPFDQAAADGYAVVGAEVWKTRRGHSRSKDIMIACHAYALGASLATLNPSDFSLVGDMVTVIVPELAETTLHEGEE